jgi:hypothetical protein
MSIPGYIVGWPIAHGVCMLREGSAMPHLMPHLLYVSATEPTAACASISAALPQAAAGDTMQRAFADGLALVVFFDEADGVTMHARVINNTIEASERRGVTIAGSFGPSHNRVTIDVSHNTIRHNGAHAVGAQAARPLVTQLIRDSYLCLHIADNDC